LQGVYQLRAGLLNDDGLWLTSSWINMTDAVHLIELDWSASTGVNANNGRLTISIDGVARASLIAIDNDTLRINEVDLGVVSGIDTGTRGTLYFDEFTSDHPSEPMPPTSPHPSHGGR